MKTVSVIRLEKWCPNRLVGSSMTTGSIAGRLQWFADGDVCGGVSWPRVAGRGLRLKHVTPLIFTFHKKTSTLPIQIVLSRTAVSKAFQSFILWPQKCISTRTGDKE